jgi:hypothetical protein
MADWPNWTFVWRKLLVHKHLMSRPTSANGKYSFLPVRDA